MADLCAACKQEFENTDGYLAHTCEATGYNPTQVEHQDALTGGNFSKIAEAALARGEENPEVPGENETLPKWLVEGEIDHGNEKEKFQTYIEGFVHCATKEEAEAAFMKKYGGQPGASLFSFEVKGLAEK